MKRMAGFLLAGAVALAPVCAEAEPPAGEYVTPWHDPAMAVTSILLKNKARGCGEYYYLDHRSSSNQKLVYCTPDGKSWLTYIVWVNIGRMTGPHEPLEGVPAPR